MKKLTKKAFVAIFALFLAVVALGTTTFAWLTLGNTVVIQEIELDFTGGEGIEFAYVKHGKDGTAAGDLLSGYVQNMTDDQFLGYLATDYYGTEQDFKEKFYFDLVTSSDGTSFSKLEVDRSGDSTKASIVPITGGPAANVKAGVVEFTLRFRTKVQLVQEQGETKINLVWNHLTLDSPKIEDWRPDRTFTNSKGDEVTPGTDGEYYASDAARVSVTGNIEGAPATQVYENPESDTNTVMNETIIWDKGAHNYYKEVAGDDLKELLGENTHTPVKTFTDSPDDKVVATFGDVEDDGYRYANLTIRIYLDGFDAEGYNSILASKLQVAFKFTFNKE